MKKTYLLVCNDVYVVSVELNDDVALIGLDVRCSQHDLIARGVLQNSLLRNSHKVAQEVLTLSSFRSSFLITKLTIHSVF